MGDFAFTMPAEQAVLTPSQPLNHAGAVGRCVMNGCDNAHSAVGTPFWIGCRLPCVQCLLRYQTLGGAQSGSYRGYGDVPFSSYRTDNSERL